MREYNITQAQLLRQSTSQFAQTLVATKHETRKGKAPNVTEGSQLWTAEAVRLIQGFINEDVLRFRRASVLLCVYSQSFYVLQQPRGLAALIPDSPIPELEELHKQLLSRSLALRIRSFSPDVTER